MADRLSSSRIFAAQAPSNIALVKYMGKKPDGANLPENPSLSMTLEGLCSLAEIELSSSGPDKWVPELPRARPLGARLPRLDEAGTAKVMRHMQRVRDEIGKVFRERGLRLHPRGAAFSLRTANTFPEASGIASSASSFAAITLAAALACAADPDRFQATYESEPGFRRALARLSRAGSGSSCRSFEGPWVQWAGEETEAVSSPLSGPLSELSHLVLVVSEGAKRVSSSQAHSRVKSSPLWEGRVRRAEERLRVLRSALERGDLDAVARAAWSEAWEMHSLFHTSAEPFSYWEPGTIEALQFFAPSFSAEPRAEALPIVTLDAGPNVHVIVASRDAPKWKARLLERFPSMALLEDRPGRGARCWVAGEGGGGR